MAKIQDPLSQGYGRGDNHGFLRRRDIIGFLIVSVGIGLLCYRFIVRPDVFPDELGRYEVILGHSFLELGQLGRLGVNVHDPYGFLAAVKFLTLFLPEHEYFFRLFPFFCAISALLLFSRLRKWFLENLAGYVALGLMALCPTLFFYSSRLMPYASDVLVTILILFLFKRISASRLDSLKETACYSLLGALAVIFSLPSIFILAGAGLGLIVTMFPGWRGRKFRNFLAVYVVWLLSFGAYYFNSIRFFIHRGPLLAVWRPYLGPATLTAKSVLVWFLKNFYEMFASPLGVYPLLGMVLFVWGSMVLWHKKRLQALLLLGPFGILIIAACFDKYPLQGRVLSFFLPIFCILIGCGWQDFYTRGKQKYRPVISLIILVFLFVQPIRSIQHEIMRSYKNVGFESAITHIRENFQEGDGIYVYANAVGGFQYFQKRYPFDEQVYILGSCFENSAECLEDLRQFAKFRRVWLLMGTSERLSWRYLRHTATEICASCQEYSSRWCGSILCELDQKKYKTFLTGKQ